MPISPPPLSLYVHLPWCVRKCPYCDFNSHAQRGELPERDYVDALLRDLDTELPHILGRDIETIFFGGGTPSLFSPLAIARLLAGIRARVPVSRDAEITLEANPGTVDSARFGGFREAGINRLSIGVQSFDSRQLEGLGRIHDGPAARRAIEAARHAGFDNFNLDLMFGLPGQDTRSALADVDMALEQRPAHLSLYQLTIEPNTAFHVNPPPLPEDDDLADTQAAIVERVGTFGFHRYEVSAYALASRESRHNLNYWRFGDYLGIGAGAHGKITTDERIFRRWKIKHPKDYLAAAGTPAALGADSALSPEDAAFEFMLNALRLTNGFAPALFENRTGQSIAVLDAELRAAEAQGLLEMDAGLIRASARGFALLNDLLVRFLPDSRPQSGQTVHRA